jgi:hypothetical protein
LSVLADAIASETATKKGPSCETGLLIASLPADQRADLDAALDSTATTAGIVRALKGLGYKVPTTFGRHRNGDCRHCPCPRTV